MGEALGEDQAGPSALHSKLEASSQSLNFPWRDLSRLIRSKHSLCQIITLFSRQLQNLLYQLARSPAAAVYRWLLVRWLRVCPPEKAGTRERRAGSGPGAPRCCLWEWAAEGGRAPRGVEPANHSRRDRSVLDVTTRGCDTERRRRSRGEAGRQGRARARAPRGPE